MAKLNWTIAGTKIWNADKHFPNGRRIECYCSDRDTMKHVWYDGDKVTRTSTGRCQGDWNEIGFDIALDNEGNICGADNKYF